MTELEHYVFHDKTSLYLRLDALSKGKDTVSVSIDTLVNANTNQGGYGRFWILTLLSELKADGKITYRVTEAGNAIINFRHKA